MGLIYCINDFLEQAVIQSKRFWDLIYFLDYQSHIESEPRLQRASKLEDGSFAGAPRSGARASARAFGVERVAFCHQITTLGEPRRPGWEGPPGVSSSTSNAWLVHHSLCSWRVTTCQHRLPHVSGRAGAPWLATGPRAGQWQRAGGKRAVRSWGAGGSEGAGEQGSRKEVRELGSRGAGEQGGSARCGAGPV